MSGHGRPRRRGVRLTAICFGVATCAVTIALAATAPAPAATDPFDAVLAHDFTFAAARLDAAARAIGSASYPTTTSSTGGWNTAPASDWRSGFFAGALWLMYERTGDPAWKARGEARTTGLRSQQADTSSHDVGFKIFTSFGNAYRLTLPSNDAYRQVILTAAGSLASRYSPTVGSVRSWGATTDPSFQVIIDNMMNLELLFWAAQHGGSPAWQDMAVSHALKTRDNHVRADGSTYQLVVYDSATGAVKSRGTHQGANAESTWSRGQAWAVYGFTMAYRYTHDVRFLDTARRTADFFLSHLPPDKVPYWDLELASTTGQPRDSSAAAIAASGLLELSRLDTDAARGATYFEAAKAILTSLSSPAYLAEGTATASILRHGTQNQPAGSFDTGLIYGDYYFLEALLRFEQITGGPTSDTTPPSVSGRSPAAAGVPATTDVRATFSEPVSGVDATSFTLHDGTARVTATVSYDPATNSARLAPKAALAPDTTYTATLTGAIVDPTGNALAAAPVSWSFTTAAAPGPGAQTFTFTPVADTYVAQGSPASAFGSATAMSAVGTPSAKQAFLRFSIAGLPAGAGVASAKLRLVVTNDSTTGGIFTTTTNASWPESVTWNTRPAVDGVRLATVAAVALNQVVEVDVTPAITANGAVSFAITVPATTANTLGYATRNATTAANRPALIVQTG